MGLKALLDSLDDVQEELHGFYKEDGDRFVLDVDGIDDHPKVRGVVTANKANKEKRDQFRAEVEALKARLDGLPEDFDASAYEEMRQAVEGKGGQPTEEQIATIREKIRESVEKKYKGEIESREERLSKLNGALHRMTIDEGLSKAMDRAGIDQRHKSHLLPYLKTAGKIQVEEGDSGYRAVVDTDMGPMELDQYVSEWASSDAGKLYVAKPTGPNPKGGAGGGGAKTIKRAEFDALDARAQAATVREGVKVVD